jgi:hypothetical protein
MMEKMFMNTGYDPTDPMRVNAGYRAMVDAIMSPATFAALDYEARVYSYITENIIVRNVSPNFIPLYSANSCDINQMISAIETVDSLSAEDKKQILTMDQMIF